MNKIILSTAISLAVIAVAPARATPQYGSSQGDRRADDAVIMAAVSKEAWHACRHIKNRHQRHHCEQTHMHGDG
jgi:hypothetical protein